LGSGVSVHEFLVFVNIYWYIYLKELSNGRLRFLIFCSFWVLLHYIYYWHGIMYLGDLFLFVLAKLFK